MRLEFGIVILVLSSSSVVLAEVNGAPGNVFSAPFPLSLIPPTPDGPSHICNQYPASALRKGAEGFAALSFIIDADGSVKDISIAESSGNSDLDKAAISCVTTWRYRAARLNGRPQAVRRSFSIAWSLHGVQRPPITGPAYEIAYGPAPQPGAKG